MSKRDFLGLIFSVGLTLSIGFLGSRFTLPSIPVAQLVNRTDAAKRQCAEAKFLAWAKAAIRAVEGDKP